MTIKTDITNLKERLYHPQARQVIRASQTQSFVRVMLEGDELLVNALLENAS